MFTHWLSGNFKEAAYRESTEITENSLYDYAALDTKDKYAVFPGGNEPFLRIRTAAENERKILVIKDSYADCFVPFMLGEFREIDVLDLRYTNQRLGGILAEDMSISKLTPYWTLVVQ